MWYDKFISYIGRRVCFNLDSYKEEVKRLLILGAGGFGHMIQETARLLGYEEVVFLDDAVKERM